ncbi:response regulator [Thalassotalea euphylliae]|uniref:response regulator n=1 Tax=Thalassotalea euphylliae TaxID=1655234 RepID=UPI0036253286
MTSYVNQYEQITALVVDANSNMRQIIAGMLRNMGFKSLFVATNEIQVNDILNVEKVDIVFSGWQPGKLDGIKVLNKVRDNEKTKAIPFLMITDIIDQDMVRQAVSNGVSEYIVPPFNKQILQKRLDRALKIPIHSSAASVIKQDKNKRFAKKKDTKDFNILIVDDVADNIEVLRGILKPHYRIKAVTSGKNVMQICMSNQPPDIILLDIMMPEIDGLTVCKQLKQNPMTQNIVIIFITALTEADDVVRGLELGAVDYITKPIHPDVVLARVRTHTRLVLSQRVIQDQIDALVSQNTRREYIDNLLQRKLEEFQRLSQENVKYLDTKLKANSVAERTFEQLKFSINVQDVIVQNLYTLRQLEDNNYKLVRSRNETSNFIKRIVHTYSFELRDRSLEAKLNFGCDLALFTDTKLATYLIHLLFANAIEHSSRGSQIHVKTVELPHHILVSIQNNGELPHEIPNDLNELLETKKGEPLVALNFYTAFKLAHALHCQMYYHSSDKFNTIFYLKFRK